LGFFSVHGFDILVNKKIRRSCQKTATRAKAIEIIIDFDIMNLEQYIYYQGRSKFIHEN